LNQTPRAIKTILASVILLFSFYQTSAQSNSLVMGSRAMAMGNASSCLNDEWALFNNVGGLSGIDASAAAFAYLAYPDFSPFDRMAMVVSVPLGYGVAGIGAYRFGSELYNEHVVSAAFSNKIALASLGLKINYVQYQAEGFGTAQSFTVSFGGIVELTKAIRVGAYINNINQPTLSEISQERIPTYLVLGVGFQIAQNVLAVTEVEKDLDHDPVIRGGLEYRPNKKFAARTGLNLNPEAAFAGFGFHHKRFIFDYAFQYHRELAASHQASVIWKFKKTK
jgi:hypothetical protein